MINIRHNIMTAVRSVLLIALGFVLLGAASATTAVAQKTVSGRQTSSTQQPLYSEYRGVRVGMKAQDVRSKLGEPLQKADDMDFYALSDTETAQIAYDAMHQVTVISVDFAGAVGAPDYKLVVGPDVEVADNGALYKLIRYEKLGFWVSYNRSAGPNPVVTITIQKLL